MGRIPQFSHNQDFIGVKLYSPNDSPGGSGNTQCSALFNSQSLQTSQKSFLYTSLIRCFWYRMISTRNFIRRAAVSWSKIFQYYEKTMAHLISNYTNYTFHTSTPFTPPTPFLHDNRNLTKLNRLFPSPCFCVLLFSFLRMVSFKCAKFLCHC